MQLLWNTHKNRNITQKPRIHKTLSVLVMGDL